MPSLWMFACETSICDGTLVGLRKDLPALLQEPDGTESHPITHVLVRRLGFDLRKVVSNCRKAGIKAVQARRVDFDLEKCVKCMSMFGESVLTTEKHVGGV